MLSPVDCRLGTRLIEGFRQPGILQIQGEKDFRLQHPGFRERYNGGAGGQIDIKQPSVGCSRSAPQGERLGENQKKKAIQALTAHTSSGGQVL